MKIAQVEIKRTFSHHTVNEFQRLKYQIKAEASRNYILKTVWRLITPVRRYALPKFENPLRRGNHAQLKIENPPSSFLFSSSVGDFDYVFSAGTEFGNMCGLSKAKLRIVWLVRNHHFSDENRS